MSPELVFWFDQPPKVGKGCFNYITRAWGAPVVYAYMHGYSSTRLSTHWDDDDFGDAKMIDLSDDPAGIADSIFGEYPNAIHILNGFKSEAFGILKDRVLSDSGNFICFSERPGVYGEWWKRLIKRVYIPLSEISIRKKYEDHVKAYLPLGMTGVRTNLRFGWSEDKLYPFMYDPVDCSGEARELSVGKPLRFLYVGRFSRYTKGTDTLVDAVGRMRSPSSAYTLTMVGGYGDMKDEILAWLSGKDNMTFGGTWDSLTVCEKMKDFDVCVVPSKFDGWNLLVNEATRANIGLIVSDQAVSDEVVRSSGGGIVFRAGDAKALASAMDRAVSNPGEVLEWKKRSRSFAPAISSASVGEYLMAVIRHECLGEGKRPSCPWLVSIKQ